VKRFVVLSDLHAHPWSAFAKGDGLHNSRLIRSLRILDASLVYAEKEGIPWVFAGDLVHTAGYTLNVVSAGVANVLYDHPDVEKVVIWGNHDARGVGGKITVEQTIFASLIHAISMTILDPTVDPVVQLANGITIAGAGYQPRPELLEFAPPADVGLYHQTVRGSIAPNGFVFEEGIEAQELIDRYRLSIVGHIHHPQQINAPKGQGILIPGAPEHQNFGDREEYGWWVVTMPEGKKGNPRLEFIPGGSPEFRTVETPREVQADGHFYRVRVVLQGDTLPEGAIVVAPSPTTIEHRDALRGVAGTEETLQVWLSAQPPVGDVAKYLSVGRELLVAEDPTRLRNVQLTSLRLHNFCCFADQELVVRQGLWLITGRGKDYPSNGAGKSSLIGEALYWLIFGRTTKGLGADEVIRWSTKQCEVTGSFEEGNETLIVTRRRGPDGHTLSVVEGISSTQDVGAVWEAASVNEMTDKLGRYLGLTPQIFQNLAYFSQEKLLLFSSATDGERKNVLADLIGLNAYQQASSAAGARVVSYERDQARCETQAEILIEHLSQLEDAARDCARRVKGWDVSQATALDAHQQTLEDYRNSVSELNVTSSDRLVRLETMAAFLIERYRKALDYGRAAIETNIREEAASAVAERIAELNQHLRSAQIKVTNGFQSVRDAHLAVNDLERHHQTMKEQKDLCTALNNDLNRELNGLVMARGERKGLEGAIVQNAMELQQAETALSSGICPTCQQPVTEKHRAQCLLPLQQQRDELDQQSLNQDTAITKLQHDCDGMKLQHEEAVKHLHGLQALVDRLEQVESDLRELASYEREVYTLRKTAAPEQLIQQRVDDQIALALSTYQQKQDGRIERARRYVDRLIVTGNQEVSALEKTVDKLAQEQNPHTEELQNASNRLVSTRTQLTEVKAAAEEVQTHIAVYDYWRTGFSKQGLQSLLVEEIAVLFNTNRSDIFPLLSQGVYDVQFSTLSKTRAGELREKTEFLVYEHGKLIPYGTLSGGQRRRIDIGIMLVLTQAVAQWMGTRGVLGLLILDEVFGFLDTSGAEGLLSALNQIAEVVPAIYVITHDTSLQSLVPNVIYVEQDAEGISEVKI